MKRDRNQISWRRVVAYAWLALAGCTTSREQVRLDPVGPVSGGRSGMFNTADGQLRVYSATDQSSGSIVYYPHSPYSIYAPDGKHFKSVQNHIGSQDQRPQTVSIAPGHYVVYARAEGYGMVQVPIVIHAGKLTLVHLEGRPFPAATPIPEAEIVRLPNGRPVGRRAPAEPEPVKPTE